MTDEEIVGKTFGRWKALEKTSKNKRIYYLCECQCGNKKEVLKDNLISGKSLSCGCLRKERISQTKKKYNKYDLSGNFGIGYTSKNEEFYFDLEDYDKIKNYNWYLDKAGYVVSNVLKNEKWTTIKMHRIIMDVTNSKQQVDHIKHHLNDNRKSQLRIVTNAENQHNRKKLNSNTSGVTGVCFFKKDQKWHSRIWVNNQIIRLGAFSDFQDAVDARKNAEEKYYGEYSYDNSINKGDEEEDDLF